MMLMRPETHSGFIQVTLLTADDMAGPPPRSNFLDCSGLPTACTADALNSRSTTTICQKVICAGRSSPANYLGWRENTGPAAPSTMPGARQARSSARSDSRRRPRVLYESKRPALAHQRTDCQGNREKRKYPVPSLSEVRAASWK